MDDSKLLFGPSNVLPPLRLMVPPVVVAPDASFQPDCTFSTALESVRVVGRDKVPVVQALNVSGPGVTVTPESENCAALAVPVTCTVPDPVPPLIIKPAEAEATSMMIVLEKVARGSVTTPLSTFVVPPNAANTHANTIHPHCISGQDTTHNSTTNTY